MSETEKQISLDFEPAEKENKNNDQSAPEVKEKDAKGIVSRDIEMEEECTRCMGARGRYDCKYCQGTGYKID